MKKTVVHIVGTGTIGEPLIGLFTDFKHHLGVDELTFAAALWLIEPDWRSVERRLEWTKRWLYHEI